MPQQYDAEGFRKLIQRAIRCIPMGLTKQDLEDIESEALNRHYIALQNLVKKQPGVSFSVDEHAGLAVHIARCAVTDFFRKLNSIRAAKTGMLGPQQEEQASLDESKPDDSASPLDKVLQGELRDHLRQSLTETENRLLDMIACGFTDSDVAGELNLTTKIAKSRIQDLKKKCRRILCKYDEEFASARKRRESSRGTQKAGE